MARKKKKPKGYERVELETFRSIGCHDVDRHTQDEPSCFNGTLRIRRYRIVCEEIEETNDVLCARIQWLWETSNNTHHMRHLMDAAESFGYELVGSWGAKREPRR